MSESHSAQKASRKQLYRGKGYQIQYVGRGHRLADKNGYAYVHRLVAEEKIGRALLAGEVVHHKDENKQNNSPDNLEVLPSAAEHGMRHRVIESSRREPGEENPKVQCACGCGLSRLLFDDSGRRREYIGNHYFEMQAMCVLAALNEGPRKAAEVAKILGRGVSSTSDSLGRLTAEGLVAHSKPLFQLTESGAAKVKTRPDLLSAILRLAERITPEGTGSPSRPSPRSISGGGQ